MISVDIPIQLKSNSICTSHNSLCLFGNKDFSTASEPLLAGARLSGQYQQILMWSGIGIWKFYHKVDLIFIYKLTCVLAYVNTYIRLYLLTQRAKKVVSDSPRLVDFPIGLVIFVVNLPNQQECFLGKFKLQEIVINLASQKGLGAR